MKTLTVLALLTLTGCSYTDFVRDKGGEAIDAANEAALWQLCEGTSHAAYLRLVAGNDLMADHLDEACRARTPQWRPVPREAQ